MDNMMVKPLEPGFFKIAMKESWYILKIQYMALIFSACLFYGLTNTIINLFGLNNIWIALFSIFEALYIAQIMILLRVTTNKGLDLVVEVLVSLQKMIFLYILTSKKHLLGNTSLCIILLIMSKFMFKDGNLSLAAYSSSLLFFGIFIGLLDTSLVLFLVAHQQAKQYENEKYVYLMINKMKIEGNWELLKKIVFLTGLLIILFSILSIGFFSIIIFFMLGFLYSSILYQMIEKPTMRVLLKPTESVAEISMESPAIKEVS